MRQKVERKFEGEKRVKGKEKEWQSGHLAESSWCALAARAVEQGSIRSVKALIGNRPVDLLYVCQDNVCVSL